jgi:hypothetical protein
MDPLMGFREPNRSVQSDMARTLGADQIEVSLRATRAHTLVSPAHAPVYARGPRGEGEAGAFACEPAGMRAHSTAPPRTHALTRARRNVVGPRGEGKRRGGSCRGSAGGARTLLSRARARVRARARGPRPPELHLTTETVRNDIPRLFRALGVHSRLEAVAAARAASPTDS